MGLLRAAPAGGGAAGRVRDRAGQTVVGHTGERMKAWFVFLFGLVATPAFAQQVAAALPAVPDPSGTYLVYLHGRIVEDLGPRPTDPRFGDRKSTRLNSSH